MKIEGYEEISWEEYRDLPADEGIKVNDAYKQKIQYFKKAQKFPIVFEDKFTASGFAFEVLESGIIKIRNKATGDYFLLGEEEIELFNKAQEVIKKNEKR